MGVSGLSPRPIRVFYEPTLQPASDAGTVYIIEDGFGIKIGHTTGIVAKRIADLQTGNSRRTASPPMS